MESKLPARKNTRLREFDYGKHGAYFVTICTEGRKCVLSEVVCEGGIGDGCINGLGVGEGFPLPQLTTRGSIVDKWIKSIPEKYPQISIDQYVIMPNHIHLLLFINNYVEEYVDGKAVTNDLMGGRGDPSPTISSAVGWFKYHSTKEVNNLFRTIGTKLFQRSFYDHVIRNQRDYDAIVKYIYENPMRWRFDKLYREGLVELD